MAIVPVFMPTSWIDACSRMMEVEPLPATPLAGYLSRLSSAMYVTHGGVLLVIAKHLPRSYFMVRPVGVLTWVLGAMMLWIDIAERMPFHWTLVESLALGVSGAITVVLGSARQHNESV